MRYVKKAFFSYKDRLKYESNEGRNQKLATWFNTGKWKSYEKSSEVQLLTFAQLSNKELKHVYVVVFWKRPFIIVIKVNKQLKDKNTIVLQYLFLNCFQQIVRI